MTGTAPPRLAFKVSLFVPTVTEGAKSRASVLRPEKKPKKWEELGIRVTKHWGFPTCEYCGLEDLGKTASERPNLKHHVTCRERPMGVKPFIRYPVFDDYGRKIQGKFEDVERKGSFVGEAPTVSLTVPVRLVRMIPERDEDGNPIIGEDGKPEIRPVCTYDKKTYPVEEWVWNGEQWVPWFVFQKQKAPDPDAPPPPEKPTPYYEVLRGSWLAHEKAKNEPKKTLDQIADEMLDLPW